jgi:hypothetical protein
VGSTSQCLLRPQRFLSSLPKPRLCRVHPSTKHAQVQKKGAFVAISRLTDELRMSGARRRISIVNLSACFMKFEGASVFVPQTWGTERIKLRDPQSQLPATTNIVEVVAWSRSFLHLPFTLLSRIVHLAKTPVMAPYRRPLPTFTLALSSLPKQNPRRDFQREIFSGYYTSLAVPRDFLVCCSRARTRSPISLFIVVHFLASIPDQFRF